MRIGFDARYLYDHFPGIGRYIANLLPALAEAAPDQTLVALANSALPNTRYDLGELRRYPNIELVVTPVQPFSLAEQVQLPRLVRRLRLDLLHSPYYVKPYRLPCPSVVAIHDLIGWRFPQTLARRARYLSRLLLWLAVRTAAQITTLSESARADLVAAYGLPAARISVTPLAADARFAPQPPEAVAALRARYGLPQRYVLYLGANKPHKNLERLTLAWEQATNALHANCTLVIAGHNDPRYPAVQQLVAARGLAERVRLLPNLAEADLPALYSGAEVFAFPSLYEGFGLPPLEAMACGAPVLCANTSSLPEVVGDAALMVDPASVAAIAAGLRRLLDDPALRDEFRSRGLRRAGAFSWQRTARLILAVYAAVAERRGG